LVGVNVGCRVVTGGTVIDGVAVELQSVPSWRGVVAVIVVWANTITVPLKVNAEGKSVACINGDHD
jgi:hypothetical protein